MGIWSKVRNVAQAVHDPRWRYYYRQRAVEDIPAREAMARRLISNLPRPEYEATPESQTLQREGLLHLPPLLTSTEVEEMRSYFSDKQAEDPFRPNLGRFNAPAEAPKETHIAI